MSTEHDELQAAIRSLGEPEGASVEHHPIVQVVSDALVADVRSRVDELDAAGELQIRQTVIRLYQQAHQSPSPQVAEPQVPEYRRALTFTGKIETAQDARDALDALFQGHPQIRLLESGGFEVVGDSELSLEIESSDLIILATALQAEGFSVTQENGEFVTDARPDEVEMYLQIIRESRAEQRDRPAA
jgi:hypothetical protein